jgi:hypothetical protein
MSPLITDPYTAAPGAVIGAAVTNGRLDPLYDLVNGELDEPNLDVELLKQLALNDSVRSQKGRGKSMIPAAGTRTNAAYGQLTNGPDQVTGLVVPADALLVVRFRAFWNCSVAGAGRAAVFIGANQLKNPKADQAAGVVQEATSSAGTVNNWLYSSSFGLSSTDGTSVGVEGTDTVTTGLSAVGLNVAGTFNGGDLEIDGLPAGTYTVSVQFKSATGTVTVAGRKLRCRVETY